MKFNICQYIIDSVKKYPDNLAVADSVRALTYRQLVNGAMALGKELKKINFNKNTPVIILLPKSCDALTAIVATSLIGGVYVPVDVNSPTDRVNKIIKKLGSCVIVSSSEILKKINFERDNVVGVFYVDSSIEYDSEQYTEVVDFFESCCADVVDVDPCYVIFTSGSTGEPKGVSISHRGVIDYIEWAKNEYPVEARHRLASQAPFYFDNSTLDIYLSFSCAASLHIPPERIFGFPKLILDYLNDQKITTIFWVPSVLINIANSDLLGKFKPKFLEHVLFAGEAMPVPQINKWVRELDGVLFSNLYGPTEITVDCTAYSFKSEYNGDHLPIGKACKNTNILLINDSNNQCLPGEIGEILVRGSCLALGYWNDFEKTAEAFIQNPFENRFRDIVYKTGDLGRINDFGLIEFLGRKDTQIKLNGYRIELGEIEAAAISIECLTRVAVLFDEEARKIILFASKKENVEFDLSLMRKELSFKLPRYMIPHELVIVKDFDLNKNGKIDRMALKTKFLNKTEV